MTPHATLPAAERAAQDGTVFDIGYQRYRGPREGRARSWLAVYKNGIRTALALGRGFRAKVLPWSFIFILATIGLVLALIVGAAERYAPGMLLALLDLPSHADYYGIASFILFVFAAVVAPELLCPDRREHVINLYLVRPITSGDYVFARWAAFLTIMTAAAWLPQVVLLTGLVMGDPDPAGYLRANWRDIPRFLAAGLALAAYVTSLSMLVASFTKRRAYAAVFLVGLFAITTPFTIGLAQELEGSVAQWISMFSLSNIPVHVNDVIFGEVSAVTENAPARELGSSVLIGWYFAWTIVPAGVLWLRYRRWTP